jgi:hypothetical protein
VILSALEILENYIPVGHANHRDSKAHTTPKRAISNQAISTRKRAAQISKTRYVPSLVGSTCTSIFMYLHLYNSLHEASPVSLF